MLAPTLAFLLSDEKQQLETCIAALEGQNKELEAKLVELGTAQMTKTKGTSATLRGKGNNSREQCQAYSQKV
jgi:hypothetical protein